LDALKGQVPGIRHLPIEPGAHVVAGAGCRESGQNTGTTLAL
jgi:hypothetical protein